MAKVSQSILEKWLFGGRSIERLLSIILRMVGEGGERTLSNREWS